MPGMGVNTNLHHFHTVLHLLNGHARMPSMAKETDPLIRKTVSLQESVWQEIEGYRSYERIPVEAEAIRRLLLEALRAFAKRKPAK
jgi:hypothetical protein